MEAVIQTGDAGFAPKGIPHYFRNVGQGRALVLLIFNAGGFTNIDIGFMLGNVPPQVCMSQASLAMHVCCFCNGLLMWSPLRVK